MSLSIDQTQLLRSIANLIVHHPEHVKTILQVENSSTETLKTHLKPIYNFVITYDLNNESHDEYLSNLSTQIEKIQNNDIKEFLKTTISIEKII